MVLHLAGVPLTRTTILQVLPHRTMTKADHGYLTNVGISQEENRPHVMYVMWLRDANNLSLSNF